MAGKFGDFLKEIEESEFAKGGGFEIVGGVATDAIGALTSNSKYKGAQTGKAVGGGIGAAAGAVIGGPMGAKVGQALGGLAGGLIGGASDQKKMIQDYEDINYRKYSKLNLSANLDPYGSDNTFYMEDGGIVEGENPGTKLGKKVGSAVPVRKKIPNTVNEQPKSTTARKPVQPVKKGQGTFEYRDKESTEALWAMNSNPRWGVDTFGFMADKLLLMENGAPGVVYDPTTRSYGSKPRSHFNHLQNRMFVVGKEDIPAEAAHAQQNKNFQRFVRRQVTDWLRSPYIQGVGNAREKQYTLQGSVEQEAHDVIEPKLRDRRWEIEDSLIDARYNHFKNWDGLPLTDEQKKAAVYADGGMVDGGDDPAAIKAAQNAGTKAGQALIGLSPTGRERTKKKTWKPEELFEFKDSAGIKTGKYPKQHLQGVIAAARAVGEDPYEAVAFVLQESSLGLDGNRNLGYTYQEPTDKQLEMIRDLSTKTGVESRYLEPLVLYKDKLAYAQKLGYKDKAFQIQAYNGLGMLTKQMVNGADKAYGIPIGNGIDMRKNPIYGKRVLALAADLKNNPYLKTLLAEGSAVASMAEGGVVGDPPKRKPSTAELESVKADAQSFVRRRPGQFVVAPEDIHTGGEVPLVTLNGKQIPYGAPILEPGVRYSKPSRDVTEFQHDGSQYWFTDPKTGDLMEMDPADINLPQFRKAPKMAEGGQVEGQPEAPQKQLVNIELGEILINPESLEIVRKYDNKNRYKPHARKQFNEAMGNFTLIEEGMVVIPKKHAEKFEKGDNLARKSIVASILKDQAKRPEARLPRMKLGGEIGGPGDDLPFVDSLDGMIENAITTHQLFTPGRGGAMGTPNPVGQAEQLDNPPKIDMSGVMWDGKTRPQDLPYDQRVSPQMQNVAATLAGRIAGTAGSNTGRVVDIEDDTTGDDGSSGTNWAQKLSKAAMGLPTAIGVMNALGHDPYLRYDENTQYDTAKAYIQNSPTDVNIEAGKATIRRRAANTNRALLNVNSPAVRAEIAANNADRLSAEGDLVQNAVNLSTQARQRKSESLARLEEAQGQSRLNMRQKFQEELRQDSANRRMMIQAGVSEGVTNYRKAVVEDEKIRAINTMARYNKLDPNSKNLLVDTKMFGEDALDYIITRSGNGITAGQTGASGVTKTTTDGKGRVKSRTVTTKS